MRGIWWDEGEGIFLISCIPKLFFFLYTNLQKPYPKTPKWPMFLNKMDKSGWRPIFVTWHRQRGKSPLRVHVCVSVCVHKCEHTSGSSCSKLMTSLINDSLQFTSSDTQICWIFLLKKMWVAFAAQKLLTFFSAKNIRILCIESAKRVNEMTLKELVKLTTLWTAGPWCFFLNSYIFHQILLKFCTFSFYDMITLDFWFGNFWQKYSPFGLWLSIC